MVRHHKLITSGRLKSEKVAKRIQVYNNLWFVDKSAVRIYWFKWQLKCPSEPLLLTTSEISSSQSTPVVALASDNS